MISTYVCKKCGPLPTDQFYMYNRLNGSKPMNRCKTCVRDIRKQVDPSINRARSKAWCDKNREHVRVRNKQYSRNHAKQNKIKCKMWADQNRDYKQASDRASYKKNPDKYKLAAHNRMALAKSVANPPGWRVAKSWWDTMIAQYENCCAYCGILATETHHGKLVIEHIIPLSRGGQHSASNIVPSCWDCNATKGNKTPEEWGHIPIELNAA